MLLRFRIKLARYREQNLFGYKDNALALGKIGLSC